MVAALTNGNSDTANARLRSLAHTHSSTVTQQSKLEFRCLLCNAFYKADCLFWFTLPAMWYARACWTLAPKHVLESCAHARFQFHCESEIVFRLIANYLQLQVPTTSYEIAVRSMETVASGRKKENYGDRMCRKWKVTIALCAAQILFS